MQEKVIDTETFFPIVIDENGFMIPPNYKVIKRKKEPSKGVLLARKFGKKMKSKPKRSVW